MTSFENFQYYKFHLFPFSPTSQQGRVSTSRRDRSYSPRVRDFVLPGTTVAAVLLDVFGQWNREPSRREEGKEQPSSFAVDAGERVELARGRGWEGGVWYNEGVQRVRPGVVSRGDGGDRIQIPTTYPARPVIRRPSGESGWRQLQQDADRKTPCVVTVAPEILFDETDGRRRSPFPRRTIPLSLPFRRVIPSSSGCP